jgi:hypothetical protein
MSSSPIVRRSPASASTHHPLGPVTHWRTTGRLNPSTTTTSRDSLRTRQMGSRRGGRGGDERAATEEGHQWQEAATPVGHAAEEARACQDHQPTWTAPWSVVPSRGRVEDLRGVAGDDSHTLDGRQQWSGHHDPRVPVDHEDRWVDRLVVRQHRQCPPCRTQQSHRGKIMYSYFCRLLNQ